jgi:hypothetical protein
MYCFHASTMKENLAEEYTSGFETAI